MIINRNRPFKEVLLTLHKFTGNNRIYTKQSFNSLPAELPGQIGTPTGATFDLNKLAFFARNLRFENDVLVADIHILRTPEGDLLWQMHNSDYVFRTACLAVIDTSGNVSNADLFAIFMIHKDLAA